MRLFGQSHLNPDNPRGSAKARVFVSALGLTARDASKLCAKLLEMAASEVAAIGELDLYGRRYTIDLVGRSCQLSRRLVHDREGCN